MYVLANEKQMQLGFPQMLRASCKQQNASRQRHLHNVFGLNLKLTLNFACVAVHLAVCTGAGERPVSCQEGAGAVRSRDAHTAAGGGRMHAAAAHHLTGIVACFGGTAQLQSNTRKQALQCLPPHDSYPCAYVKITTPPLQQFVLAALLRRWCVLRRLTLPP